VRFLASPFDFKKGKIKMSCKNQCRLCDNLIISTAVNFDATTNALLINVPAQQYGNGCKYCFIIGQVIPASTTINAQVFITIDGDVTRYPLVNCDCTPVSACSVRTRTRYSTFVRTDAVSGIFKLQGKLCSCNTEVLPSIPAPAPAVAVAELRATPSKVTRTTTTTKKEVVSNE
jgi:hypothetical protein